MKIIAWFKGLSWIVIAGAMGVAAMMVLRAFNAGKLEAEIDNQEAAIRKLHKGTREEIKAAAALQVDITVKKVKAREIRKKSEKSLERIGQHETMGDIAERFNGKRVRSRSSKAT